MAIQKIMLNDEEIFIDDELKDEELDNVIKNEDLENTTIIAPINTEELFDKTSLDIFGGNNE